MRLNNPASLINFDFFGKTYENMIHETPRIYIDSDDFFAHLEFSRPGRGVPGRVWPGPAGPLVCVEGGKSENGQYLVAKFPQ